MRDYSIRYDYVLPFQSKLPFWLAYQMTQLNTGLLAKKDPTSQAAANQAEQFLDPEQFNRQQFIHDYYQMVEYDRLDSFIVPRLNHKKDQRLVSQKGIETIKELKKAGRKIILTSGHFGRFWMIGPVMQAAGYTLSPITRDGGEDNTQQLHPAEFRYRQMKLNNIKAIFGGPFFTENGDMRAVYQALNEHCLVMLFDVPYADYSSIKTVQVDFLKRRIQVPIGLYRLALKNKAAVVPFFAVDQKNGKVCIEFQQVIEAHEYSVEDFMQSIACLLEQYILKNPSQWWLWGSLPDLSID